jgi:YD repeat-containing protein
MKKTIIAISLLLLTSLVASAQRAPDSEKSLSLRISPDTTRQYVVGEALPITLTFKNVSKKHFTFTLAEKDKNPPGFIWARVWDAKGRLLTQNDTLEDGWWTWWVMWSSTYKEKTSDLISLEPDEEYTRTINLNGLLLGCPGLPSGLKAGTYRVQLAFGKANISNEIVIRIARK